MPDINLDSLFIIGIILASLIGKFFKKDETENTEKPPTKPKNEATLEDVIKEAWQQATSPKKTQSIPPPIRQATPSFVEKSNVEVLPKKNIKELNFSDTNLVTKKDNIHYETKYGEASDKKRLSSSYFDQLSSKDSIRTAFVLREILGKPVAFKNSRFNY